MAWWAYPYSPWACARFPWLPRRWWAYPPYGYWPYLAYSWAWWAYPPYWYWYWPYFPWW